MSKLIWDKVGERLYETGVDHGVLYPIQTGGQYNKGVAWNGLSAVTESPSGAEPSPIYADNIKYLNLNKKTQVITPSLLGEMVYDVVDQSHPPASESGADSQLGKGAHLCCGGFHNLR